MIKRIVTICLTLVLLLGLVLPMSQPAHAAYENTHTNTGNQRADIIAVAVTQLGYAEEAGGWTKYGDYHGNPYADWCGYFVSWCARQAGVPTSVLKKQGWAAASKWGLSTFTANERLPQPGDLYFRGTAHVGLVYYVSGDYFYTLEGNSVGDKVISRALSLYSSSYSFASPNYGGSNNASHTHNMQYYCEDAHPHKEYKKCTGCDYVVYTGANQTKSDCKICIQENCSHTFTHWESTGDTQHRRTCSSCGLTEDSDHGWTDLQTTKAPTCGADGSKNQYCSACGAERTVTLEKTNDHRYSVWKTDGESTHSRVCSVCQTTETAKHEWTDKEVIKAPTCKEEGSKIQVCANCTQERTVTIPVSDEHSYGEWEYYNSYYHVRTCTVCEKTETKSHQVDGENWESDEENHWHHCVDCKEKYEEEAHVFTGDCVSPCEICEYVSPDGHNYGSQWQYDDHEHWQKCVDCGDESLPSDHVYDNDCDDTCNLCGYQRDAGHIYGDGMHSDAAGHWYECERCGHVDSHSGHTPGAEATEESGQFCTDCGYEIAPPVEHVHSYTYESDGVTHWGRCGCGYELAPENHQWDMNSGTCSVCGAAGVQQVESRSWEFVWLIMAGAVVTTTVVTTAVMVHGIKKRKAAQNG